MSDMLVKLYALPADDHTARLHGDGVTIRRALAPEKYIVAEWVQEYFNEAWASECEVSFARQPLGCFIALEDRQLIGFACYEATLKNFFGPTGVLRAARGRGVGSALLFAALNAMRAEGYAYAIIGGVGDNAEYYAKTVGATIIENSTPGIYRDLLR